MLIVSKHWVEKFLVGKEVRPISDLLADVDLKLCAANGTDIPFLGWISCEFQLKNSTELLSVPFLVSKQELDYPFIVYNIIEELCSRTDKTGEQLMKESLVSSLSGTTTSNVDAFVNFVQIANDETLCNVKSIKRDITIKPKVVSLPCRANPGSVGKKVPALFQPDESHEWLDGIEILETLVNIPGDNSCHLSFQAENITDHEI